MKSFVPFCLGVLIGFFCGGYVVKISWEQAIIEKGNAYYHPKTGNFAWRTNNAGIQSNLNLK